MKTLYIKCAPGAVEFYRKPDATAKTLVKRSSRPYQEWASRKRIRHNGEMFRLEWIMQPCRRCQKPVNASLMSGLEFCVPCTSAWIKHSFSCAEAKGR